MLWNNMGVLLFRNQPVMTLPFIICGNPFSASRYRDIRYFALESYEDITESPFRRQGLSEEEAVIAGTLFSPRCRLRLCIHDDVLLAMITQNEHSFSAKMMYDYVGFCQIHKWRNRTRWPPQKRVTCALCRAMSPCAWMANDECLWIPVVVIAYVREWSCSWLPVFMNDHVCSWMDACECLCQWMFMDVRDRDCPWSWMDACDCLCQWMFMDARDRDCPCSCVFLFVNGCSWMLVSMGAYDCSCSRMIVLCSSSCLWTCSCSWLRVPLEALCPWLFPP